MAHDMVFGIIENEVEMRMQQLRKLDEEHANGELYPECPRCEGSRTVEAIVKLNGEYYQPVTEFFSCPLCSGTGEADAEKAEEWLLEIVEYENKSDEDEDYLEGREKIA